MTYTLISEYNISEGFHILFFYVNDTMGGLFIPSFLFCWFLFLFLATFSAHKRFTSEDSLAFPFVASAFSTGLMAILMRLLTYQDIPLVNLPTFSVVMVVAAVGIIWFLNEK